ncbi:hypothetical protein JTE90_027670 [Oedothorax gibbosus]|uniref:Uncharacterized protein n=1 Tax=Oedothorax gibbosus TaxID=931172 RepID=A0AAV6UNG2_9ARAC|nr:hypothetical protein JTE90_027670 [Oedothorax gibbosus]
MPIDKSTILGLTVAVYGGAKIDLTNIGFTRAGVKLGSLAANMHSSIGDVASKWLFSRLQELGACGQKDVVIDAAGRPWPCIITKSKL